MPARKLTHRQPRRNSTSVALSQSEVASLDRIVEARREATGRYCSRSMVLREAVLAVLRLDEPETPNP